jgi:hypothetical protein
MTVAVESDASSAEMVDMAAAKMAAMSSPIRPTGRCVITKVGNT